MECVIYSHCCASQIGIRKSIGTGSTVCWRVGGIGHIQIELTSAGSESNRCSNVVQSIHRRFDQSNGSQSLGQSLFLQKRLSESATLGIACVSQYRKWGDASRELLSTGTFVPRPRRLRSSLSVLLSINTICTDQFCVATLRFVLFVCVTFFSTHQKWLQLLFPLQQCVFVCFNYESVCVSNKMTWFVFFFQFL